MRNPFGYKVLRTYQQGKEIYVLTKQFTAAYLDSLKDRRLIAHMNDSARSIPRNIAEGYGRNNTKQYYEFLGFSLASLVELLEDYFDLEQEIKGIQRKTRDDQGVLREISRLIKLLMGEKTMLVNQMEEIYKMAGDQGLIPHQQLIAQTLEEHRRREEKFDKWIQKQLRKAKGNKG